MSWIRYVALVSATLISYGTSAQQSLPLVFADAARKTIASHPQLEQFSRSKLPRRKQKQRL
jgi:hypothetical protein